MRKEDGGMRSEELGMRNMICGAAFLAAAAVVIAACSMGEQSDGGDRSGGLTAVRFASDSIVAAPDTAAKRARVAGNNTWEGTDTIGIFMVGNGTTNVVEAAGTDIPYTPASTGTGTVGFTSTTPIYYPVDVANTVDFIAYYPRVTPSYVSGWTYTVDLTDQTKNNDLMWAGRVNNGGNGYHKNSGTISLTFVHKLVKLVFDITASDGVTEAFNDQSKPLTVKITGQENSGTFDLTTGGLVPTGGSPAPITAKTTVNTADTADSEAIVFPNEGVGGMTFIFTTKEGEYVVAVPDPGTDHKWKAGNKYTYTVLLKRNAVQIEGTVTGWGNGGTSDTLTSKPKFPNP